jgi:uncharacterized protein YggE
VLLTGIDSSMTRLPCLLALIAAASLPASGQPGARQDSATVIETGGVGTIKLTPDRAIITITIAIRDSSAAVAARKNAALLRAVLDSLNVFRQSPETVTVVGLSVRPTEDRARAIIVSYEAAASVQVSLRNLERVGPILDVALRTGATGLQDIQYRSDREGAARRDALAVAYANAQSDAQALAAAAGLRLGPLLRISTADRSNYISLAESTGWESITVAPRDIRVSAHVTTSFRLLPRR